MTLFTATTRAASHDVPADAREVFDVSGAGDTVIATLATLLGAGADAARRRSTSRTARRGIVVGKLGTSVVGVDELLA